MVGLTEIWCKIHGKQMMGASCGLCEAAALSECACHDKDLPTHSCLPIALKEHEAHSYCCPCVTYLKAALAAKRAALERTKQCSECWACVEGNHCSHCCPRFVEPTSKPSGQTSLSVSPSAKEPKP